MLEVRNNLRRRARGEEARRQRGAKVWKEEAECGKVTAVCGSALYEARPIRRAPEPSLEVKRRSCLVLAAQSMTRGPMSVPCSWGTHSYCAKTRVVIRNYALRS